MVRLDRILNDLRAQRKQGQATVDKLDRAIEALTEGRRGGPSRRQRPGRPPVAGHRRLSAAARKRIADAQRARWARVRAQKLGKPERP